MRIFAALAIGALIIGIIISLLPILLAMLQLGTTVVSAIGG